MYGAVGAHSYGEQLDAKMSLAHPSKLGSLDSVTAAAAQWDAIINPRAAELRDTLFAMTAVTTASPAHTSVASSGGGGGGGGGSAKKKK